MMRIALGMTALLLLQAAAAKTTRDGVYTTAQAARGQAIYTTSCASCHGVDLDGAGQAPPLAGKEIEDEWKGMPLGDLFTRIHTTMPADAPGTLKPTEVADVLAFILSKGHHPAGQTELASSAEALKSITYAPR